MESKKFHGLTLNEWTARMRELETSGCFADLNMVAINWNAKEAVFKVGKKFLSCPLAMKLESGKWSRLGNHIGDGTNECVVCFHHDDDTTFDSYPTKRALELKEQERNNIKTTESMRTRNSNTSNTRVQNNASTKPVNNNKRTPKRKHSELRSAYDEKYGINYVWNAYAYILAGKEAGEVTIKVTPKVVCIESNGGSLWEYRPRVAYIADTQSGLWDKENSRYKLPRASWEEAKAAWEKAGKPASFDFEREEEEVEKPQRTRSNAKDTMLSSSVILSAFDKFVEAQNAANDAFKKALLDAAGVKPRTSGNARTSRRSTSRRAK